MSQEGYHGVQTDAVPKVRSAVFASHSLMLLLQAVL